MMSAAEPSSEHGMDTTSPRPSEPDRDRKGGASLSIIQETIVRAECRDQRDPERLGPLPRYLDLDPAEGLPPRAARLDRLIRSILDDPRWLRGDAALTEVATRAAVRQSPAANPGLIRDALRRMTPWLDLPVFQELRAADPNTITHNLPFTMAYPPEGAPSAVLHGFCDLVYQDRHGRWHVMIVADAQACRARQRLRLQLAGLAAQASGFAPVHQGWLIRHEPEGRIILETETLFDPSTIALWIAGLNSR
jgi:hypothetical protein